MYCSLAQTCIATNQQTFSHKVQHSTLDNGTRSRKEGGPLRWARGARSGTAPSLGGVEGGGGVSIPDWPLAALPVSKHRSQKHEIDPARVSNSGVDTWPRPALPANKNISAKEGFTLQRVYRNHFYRKMKHCLQLKRFAFQSAISETSSTYCLNYPHRNVCLCSSIS